MQLIKENGSSKVDGIEYEFIGVSGKDNMGYTNIPRQD